MPLFETVLMVFVPPPLKTVHFAAFLIFPVEYGVVDDYDSCFSVIMDNCLDRHLCVLHIFLKSIYCLSCNFFIFRLLFALNELWHNNPNPQQRQCRCQQSDTKASQFHHNSLIIERLSYSHTVCLSRDFSTNIQNVFVVYRKRPNSQSIVTSDINIQQYQNITFLRAWIAVISMKVTISSEKHAAFVVGAKIFFLYDADIRLLLERCTYTYSYTAICCITDGRKRYIFCHENVRSQHE